MSRRLIPALLAVVLLLAPALARAEPALFIARSGAATLYLFGTIHVLKPGTNWESAKIRRAFDASADLWLEVKDLDDTAAQVPLMQQYGIDLANPLSSKLSPSDLQRVDAALKQAGQPAGEAAAEPLRPWLVGMMLGIAPALQEGLDPKSGVDLALKAQADQAGKPVHGFETIEQQLRYFADMPQVEEISFLRSVLDDVAAGPEKLNAMLAAWEAGDVATLGKLALEDDADKDPALYRTMFTNRNIAWAKQLVQRMKTGGVSFVAVGAGHLAGPDSLVVQLQKLGVAVTRE
jgi:uncharacterized protein YbaP (TraB family)